MQRLEVSGAVRPLYIIIPNACSHISYIGVHVMVHIVTLARTDVLPEDGHTVTETCRRFYEILAF